VRVGVGLVVELVGEHRVRRLARDALGRLDVVVGVVGRHGRGRDDHLGAERLEQAHLLLAHLVGHGEDALVAPHRRGDGEPDAGVAARPLDDGAAGRRRPLRSAASTIGRPMRSLTLPPGLKNSALP
jgi:hypothetical protein